MQDNIKRLARTLHPARISVLATYLLKDEAISGKLIVGATILALIASNTLLRQTYENTWSTQLSIGIGNWVLSKDLRSWINEALMAIFFLVVGLELKRELVKGELRKLHTALLPFAAALGGMVVPALIYVSLNHGSVGAHGWAIPMATDIAFAIAILAFVGKGIPASIRLFLLTLAIVDDIGAVIVIALFYNHGIHPELLLPVGAIVIIFVILQKRRALTMPLFIIGSVLIWLSINLSGIHASIAGAIIGLLAPLSEIRIGIKSISERLELAMIPLSTLVIVPLFAFANTGIIISFDGFNNVGAGNIAAGIILGLVFGKVVGIFGASWIMVKLKFANLPTGSSWNQILGVGLLAGIGFTVSIFVTDLAFLDEQLVGTAKLSVFIASALSGVLGVLALRAFRKQ